MPIVSTVKMKADQFLVIGEDPPGVRLELVDGEVAVSPRPSLDHSYALLKLSHLLDTHIEENNLGALFTDVDTILGKFDVRCPDLLFVSREKVSRLGEKAIDLPPDLCIEILSPGTVMVDREDKFEQYRSVGVPNYWILDPMDRILEGYELKRKQYTLAGRAAGRAKSTLPPFPELVIPLSRLWRPKKSIR